MQQTFRINPQPNTKRALRGSLESVFCRTIPSGRVQRSERVRGQMLRRGPFFGVPDFSSSKPYVPLLHEEVCLS